MRLLMSEKRLGRIAITKDALGALLREYASIDGIPSDQLKVEFLIHDPKDDTLNIYISSDHCFLVEEGGAIPVHYCVFRSAK